MSSIIDKTDVMKAFRGVIANSQIVEVILTGEMVAIRDSEYDPSLHIQTVPETRIIDLTTQLAVKEAPFDPQAKPLWVREDFMPAAETSPANTVGMLSGIYRLTVFVPTTEGGNADIISMNLTTKYLQQIFSAEKDVISISEPGSDGITTDAASLVSMPKEAEWLSAGIDVEFRAYRKG